MELPVTCDWEFPPVDLWPDEDLVLVGADLRPDTILCAYTHGLFPMFADRRRKVLGWWSPVVRGVLPLDGLRTTRSLRRSMRRYTCTVDAAFDEFLAQSGVTEPAAGAELPSFDVAEVAALPELTGNEDFNFLADTDETATKLELARAYIDMGDADGARDILDEVLKEGNAGQQQEAREMMGRIA